MAQEKVAKLQALAKETRVNFIVGLPRSGSTMLAALLNQNPRIYATGPSAAYHFFSNVYAAMSDESEVPSLMTDAQRRDVLKGVVRSIHASETGDAKVVFDTNRKWLYRLDQLVALFPLCQFIVCVRNPAKVLSSLEKSRKASVLRRSKLFHTHETLDQRVQRMMGPDGIVGTPMALIKDALQGPHAERCLVLDYDRFLQMPVTTMTDVYRFFRELEFDHDFENFSFEAPEFDAFLNAPGLHSISGPLRPASGEMLLPPEIEGRFREQDFWKRITTDATLLIE